MGLENNKAILEQVKEFHHLYQFKLQKIVGDVGGLACGDSKLGNSTLKWRRLYYALNDETNSYIKTLIELIEHDEQRKE